MIETKKIVEARLNSSFKAISDYFGYTAEEWAEEITDLLQLWQEQGYVEIYQTPSDKKFGFMKDSSQNLRGNISPFYIGLFHARLIDGKNDPLVVVKFHETPDGDIVDMRFMIDHKRFFGNKATKRDHQFLHAMWLEIDGKIQIGDQDHK